MEKDLHIWEKIIPCIYNIYHVAANYLLCALFGVQFTFPYNGFINLPFDYTIIINPLIISIFAAIIPAYIHKIISRLILRKNNK